MWTEIASGQKSSSSDNNCPPSVPGWGVPSSTRNRPNATSTRSNLIRSLWCSASCAAFPALSQRITCTPSRSSVRVHITPIIGSSSTTRMSGGRLRASATVLIPSFGSVAGTVIGFEPVEMGYRHTVAVDALPAVAAQRGILRSRNFQKCPKPYSRIF